MEFLGEWGYIGLFIGTFLAATVIPFSSDFLIIGVLVTGGNPLVSLIVATLGNWLGGMVSFGLGWLGKWKWIEKWFGVTEEKLSKQKAYIVKYGAGIAFFSWLPFVGDIFAIGLGFYKVNPKKVAIYMLIGKCFRFIFWIVLYQIFGEKFTNFLGL